MYELTSLFRHVIGYRLSDALNLISTFRHRLSSLVDQFISGFD